MLLDLDVGRTGLFETIFHSYIPRIPVLDRNGVLRVKADAPGRSSLSVSRVISPVLCQSQFPQSENPMF